MKSPIIHFGKDISWYAVAVLVGNNPAWRVITSDRKAIKVTALGKHGVPLSKLLVSSPPPALIRRWPKKARDEFMEGGCEVDLQDIFLAIRKLVNRHVSFPIKHSDVVVSLWAIMTYLFPLFPALPYLFLNGIKGSGKTTLLDLLSRLVFNPHFFTDATAAAIFRTLGAVPGTVFVDEFESVPSNMRSSLNAGYKKNLSMIPRVNNKTGETETFDVYGPKVYASIARCDDVLRSRCIEALLQPAPKDSKVHGKHVYASERKFRWVRSQLYAWSLLNHNEVTQSFKTVQTPRSMINREREKFHPLFALAALIDPDNSLKIRNNIVAFSKEQPQDDEQDERLHYILKYLRSEFDGTRRSVLSIQPKEIAAGLKGKVDEPPKAIEIGLMMRHLNFRRRRKDSGSVYQITESKLRDAEIRFLGK